MIIKIDDEYKKNLNKKIATKLFKYILFEENGKTFCLKKGKNKEKILLPDYIGVTENTYAIVEYLKGIKKCEVFVGYNKNTDNGILWNTKIRFNGVIYESGNTDNMNLSIVLATLKFLENEEVINKNKKENNNLIFIKDEIKKKR